ncbi:DUF7006 family protein [Enterococcus casseliflavus]|uniref:DUF7006 family protein n=1 Tax=Enterococcus casseliflavus TaxID=37734 RepID=UPI0023312A54|nr:hypothetical protein [Enterococcus casseliflavus]MDB1688298.1 hypothetical protein [Enterococcus casseliflavus]
MLVENVRDPKDYLEYSRNTLKEAGIFSSYPEITAYYYELYSDFKDCYFKEENFFIKLKKLLSIDAQIQILTALTLNPTMNFLEDLGMDEKEIIGMIRKDKKFFYREITGESMWKKPKWGLIYLSEESYS